jgi:hypothetical protein
MIAHRARPFLDTVVQRARAFAGHAPRLAAILRDTSRPSAERKRELRQALNACFQAERLSSRVASLAEIRRRALALEHPDASERLHRLLHNWHSLPASLAVALVVVFLSVFASALGGLVLSQYWPQVSPGALPTALLTSAEVLAGVAGLLFAALVFGMQFHGERLGEASFLVVFLARREGMVPIAAFTLAVIAANLLVGLITARFIAQAAAAMAAIDVLLLPTVLLSALWLIYRLVAVTSGDFFEQSLKPGLAWEYQRGLDEELHRAQLLQAYGEALKTAKLNYNPGAGFTLTANDSAIAFRLKQRGTVTDVNVDHLCALGELLERYCQGCDANLAIAPYDKVDGGPALVLTAHRRPGCGRVAIQPIDASTKTQIHRSLQRAFVVKRARDPGLIDLLRRFQETVVGYARYERPGQLKRALEVCEHLIEQRLVRRAREPGPPSFYFDRLPDFLNAAQYYELAADTVVSGDRDKIDAVLMLAGRIMNLGIDHRDPAVLRGGTELAEAIYRYGHRLKALQPWLAHTLDMWINHVLEQFHVRRVPLGDELEEPRADAELPLLVVALGWILRLIKTALEADLQQDAEDFHSRIFMFDRHFHLRGASAPREPLPKPLSAALDLHTYTMFVLAGWCLHLASSPARRTEALKAIFHRSAGSCGTRHDLVRVWESLQPRYDALTHLDAKLGIEMWHEPDQRWRSGVPQPALFSSSWVPRGFVALAMVRPGARERAMPNQLRRAPAMQHGLAAIQAAANALVQDAYVRDEFLGLNEDTAQNARDEFVTLIRERVCMAKRADLAHVLRAPVSPNRVADIRREVEAHVDKHRTILPLITKLGALSDAASASIARRALVAIGDCKTDYVEGEYGAGNHADLLAKLLAKEGDVRITYAAEQVATTTATARDLPRLLDAVRSAIAALRTGGFEPSLILAPFLPHVLRALCGEHWLAPPAGTDLDGHPQFENIPVIEFPYVDAQSIAVVDVAKLFGSAAFPPGAHHLSLDVEDRYAADNEALVASAQNEADPSRIADPYKLRVLVTLAMPISVGTRDPAASARVLIDPRALGYAFADSGEYYHRPNCPDLPNDPGVNFTLHSGAAANSGQREPCPKCKPDTWYQEI